MFGNFQARRIGSPLGSLIGGPEGNHTKLLKNPGRRGGRIIFSVTVTENEVGAIGGLGISVEVRRGRSDGGYSGNHIGSNGWPLYFRSSSASRHSK
jgi:hypothetical protein